MKADLLFRLVNVYPPYLGAGIRVDHALSDERSIHVSMALRFYNRNLFGTHFGGSLYSMCDPWFVILLVRLLGPAYTVWDKSASIEFLRPGKGRVSARFHLPEETVDGIRATVERDGKAEPLLTVEVRGEDGEPVARVEKRLWVRKSRAAGKLPAERGP